MDPSLPLLLLLPTADTTLFALHHSHMLKQ